MAVLRILPARLLGLGQDANIITMREQTSPSGAAVNYSGGIGLGFGCWSSSSGVRAVSTCGRLLKAAEEVFDDCLKAGREEVGGKLRLFASSVNLNQEGTCSIESSLVKGAGTAAAFFIGLSLLHGEATASEAMARLLPAAFPWEKSQEQSEPSKGTCATCIGVVGETLGSCNATANCVSSFDDRPRFFVAPWEFPGQLPVAVENLRGVLLSAGANIEEQGERYVHAVFTSKDGYVDDVEFLFSNPKSDKVVVLRSASRATKLDDKQRNKNRLEEIRKSLTWEQVPVLRNRKRTFFFLESPWDTFGPEPPPSFNYKDVPNLEPQ